MSHKPRKKSATLTYHIVVKGADRQLLFEEPKDYQKYLTIIEYYKTECQFDLFAYCLMSNHVHLLIRHSPEYPLEFIFRRINTTYAGWFNMKYNRTGFVQNSRYYSEPIEDEQYLLTALKYIHFNPTKAGIEQAPGSFYPWSSFHDYRKTINNENANTLTDTSFVLDILGPKQFHTLHETITDETCMDIDQIRKRLPDDVAKDIISEISNCHSSTEFQNLSIVKRNQSIKLIHEKGVSIRQINRLTGISRGVIERILIRKS